MRLPSGATAIPWLASIPLISPTTLFVAGSMMWMLSPAEFVWMIRSFGSGAALKENDTAHKTIPHKPMRHPRNTCLFVIFIAPLFTDKRSESSDLPGENSLRAATSTSLQIPMPSNLTTPDCPAIQNACLPRERGHHQPAGQADVGAAGSPGF